MRDKNIVNNNTFVWTKVRWEKVIWIKEQDLDRRSRFSKTSNIQKQEQDSDKKKQDFDRRSRFSKTRTRFRNKKKIQRRRTRFN